MHFFFSGVRMCFCVYILIRYLQAALFRLDGSVRCAVSKGGACCCRRSPSQRQCVCNIWVVLERVLKRGDKKRISQRSRWNGASKNKGENNNYSVCSWVTEIQVTDETYHLKVYLVYLLIVSWLVRLLRLALPYNRRRSGDRAQSCG